MNVIAKNKACQAILITFLFIFSLSSLFTTTIVNAADDFSVEAAAAYAIDGKSGKVFLNQNGDEPLPIASMTKMLTAYLVLESIQHGQLTWEDPVSISPALQDLSQDWALSNVSLNSGETYTVRDLFNATLIASANAASIALGEKVAGNNDAFIELMRTKLISWGISDAEIVSAAGLNNSSIADPGLHYTGSSPDAENKVSARGVATIAFHLVNDYPEVLEVTKLPTQIFGEGTSQRTEMQNWNAMLPGHQNFKEGVTGLKTGTTDLAGECFTGFITQDDRQVITVVMNARSNNADTATTTNKDARFTETSKLMDHVLDAWSEEIILKSATTVDPNSISVKDGKELTVETSLKTDVTAWLRKDMNPQNLTIQFEKDAQVLGKTDTLQAPVKKGLFIGNVSVSLTEDDLGFISGKAAPLYEVVTKTYVDKASFFTLTIRSIQEFFANLF